MKNLLRIAIFFTLFYQSCASFEPAVNPYKLDKNNLNELDGIYEIYHATFPSKYEKEYRSYTWNSQNFFKEIDRNLLRDTLQIDSTKNYKFGLNVLNERMLKIDYIENDSIIRSRIIKTRLENDGYLYLKNKNIGTRLIPYLFGGIDVKRSRITIDLDKNLIFDYSHHISGAFLLVIFLDGETTKRRLVYKNINKKHRKPTPRPRRSNRI